MTRVKDPGHVVRLRERCSRVACEEQAVVAPWYRYCVGAPKGKPKAKTNPRAGRRKKESIVSDVLAEVVENSDALPAPPVVPALSSDLDDFADFERECH